MSAVLPLPSAPNPRLLSPKAWSGVLAAVLAVGVLMPVLNLLVPAGNVLHASDYMVSLVGKIMCYAICALAMDLIWGYTGILSLGHGVFFALGGYAFAMYLMRQIGRDGNYKSDLPDFMVFLDWKTLPVVLDALPIHFWYCRRFWWCWCLALLAFVFGFFRISIAHQGRVLLDHYPGAHLRVRCCCSFAMTRASAATTASPISSASWAFR